MSLISSLDAIYMHIKERFSTISADILPKNSGQLGLFPSLLLLLSSSSGCSPLPRPKSKGCKVAGYFRTTARRRIRVPLSIREINAYMYFARPHLCTFGIYFPTGRPHHGQGLPVSLGKAGEANRLPWRILVHPPLIFADVTREQQITFLQAAYCVQ